MAAYLNEGSGEFFPDSLTLSEALLSRAESKGLIIRKSFDSLRSLEHFDFAQCGEPVEPDVPSFVEINNSPRAQLSETFATVRRQ